MIGCSVSHSIKLNRYQTVHRLIIFFDIWLKDGRTAEADDVLPDGHKVKNGDGVYYLSYAMGRMYSIWGEDAEEFRPERWLNNGIFQPESPFKFIAFHVCTFDIFLWNYLINKIIWCVKLLWYVWLIALQGGPRICLGKDFAYRQMKIVAMALIAFFRFKLANGTQNVTYKVMFTLHLDKGLPLCAIPRSSQ